MTAGDNVEAQTDLRVGPPFLREEAAQVTKEFQPEPEGFGGKKLQRSSPGREALRLWGLQGVERALAECRRDSAQEILRCLLQRRGVAGERQTPDR